MHRSSLCLTSVALEHRTGHGVRVAVIDSGVVSSHPHVGSVEGGVCIEPDGSMTSDTRDRLGHGTAVAAVIREKAPNADLLPVRVFHHSLHATSQQLVQAMSWSIDQGVRMINLSLGTANRDHEALLSEVMRVARERRVLVVTAYESGGSRWLPGALPGAVPVVLDPECPRNELRVIPGRTAVHFAASGLPRPIPGVPPERNLSGISFAVANVTGILALLLEEGGETVDVAGLVGRIRELASPT